MRTLEPSRRPRIGQIEATTQVQVGPEHERVLPVFLRPFESASKTVFPELDPTTQPVVVVGAGLELSLPEEHGLAVCALTAVISDDQSMVICSV